MWLTNLSITRPNHHSHGCGDDAYHGITITLAPAG